MSKFSDDICATIYEMSLDSGTDEEYGSSCDGGVWHGLMLATGIAGAEHAVLSEDSQGFVDYEVYESADAAAKAFASIIRCEEESCDE